MPCVYRMFQYMEYIIYYRPPYFCDDVQLGLVITLFFVFSFKVRFRLLFVSIIFDSRENDEHFPITRLVIANILDE